jgi:uncharacterized protein (TIGR03437 family)
LQLRRFARFLFFLTLAFLSRCAAALASEADALAISANIQARHMPHGTILDPIFAAPDSDQIIRYTRCGDSAIWTGHYLAAEAFRYKVTGSADALANAKKALAGIKSLADVTGTNLLARCLVPVDSPYAPSITQEEQHNGVYTNSSAKYYWVGGTSRDQYSGVFFGLGVAFDMIDDAGVRAAIRDLTTRLLDFLRGRNWMVVMPDGSISTTFIARADQQLSFLQVGRHVNPDHYSLTLDKTILSPEAPLPIAIDVTTDSSYFKFNLDSINLYNLIRLDGSIFNPLYVQAYNVLRRHTRDQENAFFNMIDRALNGPDAVRDQATATMLDQWLQRPRRDFFVDLRGQLSSCGSPDQACSPIPVPLRVPTDFLWQRSPFQLVGGGSGVIENAGIDYILPYWMARYYGIENADSVVSAASGGTSVSAESIASFYGSGLASGVDSAKSLPLPLTLGGVRVQVQDSAGVSRMAPLFYVSPTQINLEIPAGTAAGQATVTVLDANNTALVSTTADVQAVAPGLFTADGSGKGVAAALAIQVGVNNLQNVTPIFDCAGGVCASVPIKLGVDRPVYLSLYGTGIRNRSSLANVTVVISATNAPVLYAGPQGSYAGLDQVNVAIPLSLRGAGETDLLLTVDGKAANSVRVNIQ